MFCFRCKTLDISTWLFSTRKPWNLSKLSSCPLRHSLNFLTLNFLTSDHVNEISSISSNFSNFSLTINFDKIGANQSVTKRITSQIDVILDPNNSSSSRTSASNQDSRTFYFQTLDECQKFSFELQKSIIQCNNLCTTAENKRDNKAVISGDALPVDQIKNLNELKDKFHERGEKLQKAVDNSERMRNSAQTFSNNARALRKQYSNSIWTSSK